MTKSIFSNQDSNENNSFTRVKWNCEEDALLLRLRTDKGQISFNEMCQFFPGKNANQIAYRYKKLTKGKTKYYWSRDEDVRLAQHIENYGEDFNKLIPFFKDKSASDIEARYYKKIKHLKLGFTIEEDEAVLKLYRTRQLSLEEIQTLRGKGHIEIKRRIESLLNSKGEQMNKSFNASSILSSSCSSTANLDSNYRMDVEDDGYIPQIKSKEAHNSWCNGQLCSCIDFQTSSSNQYLFQMNDRDKLKNDYCKNTIQSVDKCLGGNPEFNCNYFFSELLKEGKNNSNLNKFRDFDLSDICTFPLDINDSCIQRLNEPEDSFEASFYSAFKIYSNDNFLDLDEEDDLEKVLNQASSSEALANFISKKRSLEQTLNKIHRITKTCITDIESKEKLTLTSEDLLIFNDLLQKLKVEETEYKQALDTERHDLFNNKGEIGKGDDKHLLQNLGKQVEFLIKLIHINKLKLKLFKRSVQRNP